MSWGPDRQGRPTTSTARRAAAEGVGTAFLVAAVVGSGIMATRLTDDGALRLLCNSVATGAVLVALILALQPVSASFNPVVTLVEGGLGLLPARDVLATVAAQMAGGVVGVVVANLMFDLPAVSVATTDRVGPHLWLAEVVATLGLVTVVFGALRSGRTESVALAVGGYITAAYWFTSSTSFANPAVAFARTLSDTFTGIDPQSAPMFMLMQLVGGGLAYALLRLLYPSPEEVVP